MAVTLPSIFGFTCYRAYLDACMTKFKNEKSISARALALRCGITSPNYLQQVVQEKRNLTQLMVERIGKAFGLPKTEQAYFLSLLKLTTVRSGQGRDKVLKSMQELIRKSETRVINDKEFRDNWANPIVWELMKTNCFVEDPVLMVQVLRNAVSAEEITHAINYLEQRGHFAGDPNNGAKKPQAVEFQTSNDIRRIDLQRSHLRFLQLAQHRLHDPLEDREFQGLTVAIKKDALIEIKKLMREFVVMINEKFSQDQDADEVIRVQLCCIKLSKS